MPKTNEAKHTPGPWTIEGTAILGKAGSGLTPVASIYANDDEPTVGSSEDNARLIAAAPELLEAAKQGKVLLLQMAALMPKIRSFAKWKAQAADVWPLLEAAIAKAKGGTND